jgi:hypothetical protein
LALARNALQDGDNVEAYRALGWPGNEIFILASEQGNQMKALLTQLKPLQDSVQKAQEALQQGNNSTALNEVGSAEVSLLQVTQKLPSEDTDTTEEPEGGG